MKRNVVHIKALIIMLSVLFSPRLSSMDSLGIQHRFESFLQSVDLAIVYQDKTVYPASFADTIPNVITLSTKDWLVVIHDKSNSILPTTVSGWRCWRVVKITDDGYGDTILEGQFHVFSDNQQAIEGYYCRWAMTNIGAAQHFRGMKRNDRARLGDWALCYANFDPDKQCLRPCRIEFCRNGIVVLTTGNDCDHFKYLQFLREFDAILQHDPAKPFKAPEGFSEAEYQKNLEKYLTWLKEKENKENEQRERELAKLRAEAARPRPPARPQQPFFVWTDEIAAPGKELMRKWFPDSPEELGTWRGGYAAAPGNPLSQRVTAESLRGRFPIVSPLSPRYGRGDAFHVCLSSRDGKERCAVAVLHARSAAEAREALAWLCLTGGDCGGLRKIGGEPVRFKKRPSLAIGDFCVSNQGEVREDGTVAPGSDEREIYFLRGDTAAMVRALPPAPGAGAGAAPGGSAIATAKRLDGIIKEALAPGQ